MSGRGLGLRGRRRDASSGICGLPLLELRPPSSRRGARHAARSRPQPEPGASALRSGAGDSTDRLVGVLVESRSQLYCTRRGGQRAMPRVPGRMPFRGVETGRRRAARYSQHEHAVPDAQWRAPARSRSICDIPSARSRSRRRTRAPRRRSNGRPHPLHVCGRAGASPQVAADEVRARFRRSGKHVLGRSCREHQSERFPPAKRRGYRCRGGRR